jgi:hypothetical protein
MLGVQLAELLDGDRPGVDEALDLVTGFDVALAHGFGRLGEERAEPLVAMAGALAATPLGERLGEAAGKLAAGSVGGEHVTTLAGGRTALFGAVHDALLDRLDTALGRTRGPWAGATPAASPANLLAGCQSWLHELAITGWRGVDHDLVSSADQTMEALLAVPGLRGLAVLLDGLAAELRASCPVASVERLPVRRWADLWARALMLSQGPPADPDGEPVSGRLLVLGADVHEHGTAVRVQVHGVLEVAGAPDRLVRTSVAAAKVDTIIGPAVWRMLAGFPVLVGALAERRSLDITDMSLLPGGDLIWQDGQAVVGEPADPFAVARVRLAGAVAAPVPPLDRHPVRIAEPVLVEGYRTVSADGEVTFTLDGRSLAVDVERLPGCGPLTPQLVARSSACVGLVRWDGGRWLLQPLAVQATVKKQPVVAHNGDWAQGPTDPKVVKTEARSGDVVAVLRERAGRLLRR